MFKAQTPSGKATYILRGAWTPRGKKSIAKVSVLDAGNVDRVIWDLNSVGGGAFAVTPFPTRVSGAGASSSEMTIRTTAAEVTVSGSVGVLSYEWTKTSGAGSWEIEKPLASRTNFAAIGVAANSTETATFTCTVTDGAGRTNSATVNASARNYGDPGGTLEP